MPERKLSLMFNPRYIRGYSVAEKESKKDVPFYTDLLKRPAFNPKSGTLMRRVLELGMDVRAIPTRQRDRNIITHVKNAIENNELPFIVNGSHVDLFHSLHAFMRNKKRREKGKIGVVVIDRHMDAASPHFNEIEPGTVLSQIHQLHGIPKKNIVVLNGKYTGKGKVGISTNLRTPKRIDKEDLLPKFDNVLNEWANRGVEDVWFSFDVDYLRELNENHKGYTQAHHWKGHAAGGHASDMAIAQDVYNSLRMIHEHDFNLLGVSVEEYDPDLDYTAKGSTSIAGVIKGVAGLVHHLWLKEGGNA